MNGDTKEFTDHWKNSYEIYCKNIVKIYNGKPLSFDEWLRMCEDNISRIKEKMISDKRNVRN